VLGLAGTKRIKWSRHCCGEAMVVMLLLEAYSTWNDNRFKWFHCELMCIWIVHCCSWSHRA
jgi:hypothetical protein